MAVWLTECGWSIQVPLPRRGGLTCYVSKLGKETSNNADYGFNVCPGTLGKLLRIYYVESDQGGGMFTRITSRPCSFKSVSGTSYVM